MSSHKLSDILITIKSASHVPVGDAIAQSSDPYVLACLTPRVPPSPDHPPFPLTYRSTTARRTRNPEWNETWHLGGIPEEGFDLKIKLYDEDKPGDWDDKLGVAEVSVRKLPSAASDGKPGEEEEHELKIQKKRASKRVYALTYLVAWCHADFKKQRGRITISIQNLGKSTCTRNCPCVLGPMRWSIHTSPMIGRIAGTQAHPTDPLIPSEGKSKVGDALLKVDPIAKRNKEKKERSQKNQSYVFEANKIQLLGTIPKDLRNEFVEFRPFIGWVFNVKGVRGYIANRGLHAQHRRIYSYDPSTKTGLVATPPEIDEIEAGEHVRGEKQKLDDTDEFAASRQFLEMVHWDEKPHPKVPGGRLYTYVITLQGEWRFTETGPEFTIDFLSKHSMHSDVSKEIACAGEFFIRRRRGRGHRKSNSNGSGGNGSPSGSGSEHMRKGSQNERKSEDGEKKEEEFEEAGFGTNKDDEKGSEQSKTEDHESIKEGSPKDKSDDANASEIEISRKAAHVMGKSRDPHNFVLIIDNDSGTYRPDSKSLPSLQKYLERNLPGLKIKAMACDDEKLKKWKEEQKPKKEVLKARKIAQVSSSSSDSSSDDEAVQLDE